MLLSRIARLSKSSSLFCNTSIPIHRRLHSTPSHDPLRILFCGSDHFSATSLKALFEEYAARTGVIESIDILCKEDKRSGRGLRTLKEVPIKDVARSLDLPIHEIVGFKGWNFPVTASGQPPNLIVAVSFGLLIPGRLINAATYGGINVHPSLLPMYQGSAPIYHTLLDNAPITGVTVQTLHPKEFDKGAILLQTDPPISVPKKTSYQMLHDALAVHGAEMLVETCRRRLFVPPINPVVNSYKPSHAPRIKPEEHARVDWRVLSAEEVEQKCGVLGTVWCRFGSPEEPPLLRIKRVILSDISKIDLPEENIDGMKVLPGGFEYLRMEDGGSGDEILVIKCREGGGWVRVGGIKMEAKNLVNGGEWARSVKDQVKSPRMFMAEEFIDPVMIFRTDVKTYRFCIV